jgi:EAL domain-containing protein (putative c-di-GMP-specific phosphodiesterase class I)
MAKQKRGEEQRLYLESMVATLTGWDDPQAKLLQAFETDEFMLFGQSIVPLDREKKLPICIEILIRLKQEEQNLTPPGAFLPILDYFEMMPDLDRWVIRHAADWWKSRRGPASTVLNFNVSPETLDNPDFAGFVAAQLRASGLPSANVCFELPATDLATAAEQALKTAADLKTIGCQLAVTAFGRDAVSFDALRAVGGDVVKIDGGIVRMIHTDEVSFAKVRSIQRVCTTAGVRTIAEFVEQAETLAKLREIGVDYVQGYGVSRPEPLVAAA